MLWRWLAPAIAAVEGGRLNSETFEPGYYDKYKDALEKAAAGLGWPARQQATSYGIYQILGENLARHHGMKPEDLPRFLASEAWQNQVARKQFYLMLDNLIRRRGLAWPHYLYSMWNAGSNYNDRYSKAVRSHLK